MKKTIIATLAATLITGNTFALSTVNFDDMGFSSFDDVTTQYASLGVVFEGIENGVSVNLEAAGSDFLSNNTPPSAPMSLSNFFGNDTDNRADIMRISFTDPTSLISFEYNGAGVLASFGTFNVYDTGGILLSSFSPSIGIDSSYHLISIPETGVGHIDIIQPVDDWGHYIDNLSFESVSSTVPEMGSTSLLLVCALAGISRLRKKLN